MSHEALGQSRRDVLHHLVAQGIVVETFEGPHVVAVARVPLQQRPAIHANH